MKSFSIALAVSLFSVLPCHGNINIQDEATTVVLTGDILLDRGVRQVIEHRGIDRLFSPEIDALLHDAQVVVGNLECPELGYAMLL